MPAPVPGVKGFARGGVAAPARPVGGGPGAGARGQPLMQPRGRRRATLFEMPASAQASTTLATSL